MLHFYQSNRLDTLAEFFGLMTRQVPLGIFEPETIIVQSHGVGRWLTFHQAKQQRIAANTRYLMPASFAWQLIRQCFPDVPLMSPFSPDVLVWRLLKLLPTLNRETFEPIAHYFQPDPLSSQQDIFELSGKIADIYDQYLVFRPLWLQAWEAGKLLDLGKDEAWQAALWRELSTGTTILHRASLLSSALQALQPQQLPARITLFGISSLAPSYLQMIKHLATLTDVCLFTLNPCQEYWGDIIDEYAQISQYKSEAQAGIQGHPLLASLGKQGRDFFEAISADTDIETHDLFSPAEGETILAQLQRDILTLSTPAESPQRPLAIDDHSIAVHIVHNPVRELEVLKDQLLACFDNDPSLTPADIAVLTPDIAVYVPFIHAVFAHQGNNHDIPYNIADTHTDKEYPLLITVCALLDVLDSRFAADDVLTLLDCQALCRRFGFDDNALLLINHWIKQAPIYWGFDKAQKETLDLPAENNFTWRHGIDRLLLGAVMPENAEKNGLFSAIASLFPQIETSDSSLTQLAQLAALYDVLARLAATWRTAASMDVWQQRLEHMMDALFLPDESDAPTLNLWQSTIAALKENTLIADVQQIDISFAVIKTWLKRCLTLASDAGFLNGGVTFGAMVPMRNLPFRVICLIGLDSDIYPREEKSVSFDLIAQHPQRGDRSRKEDDRYLFLEALLSAQERFYLSYVGRSNRSNAPIPPSPLVSELLDTLAAMCDQPQAIQQMVTEHPLQPFSSRYFKAGEDKKLFSYDSLYANALTIKPHLPTPFIGEDLPATSQPDETAIEWDEFRYFWRLPARIWLSQQLNLSVTDSARFSEQEPFTPNRRLKNQLSRHGKDQQLMAQPDTLRFKHLSDRGVLPVGKLGEAYFSQEQIYRHQQKVPEALEQPLPSTLPFQIKIQGMVLRGALTDLSAEGCVTHKSSKVTPGDTIDAWLMHLVLSCLQPVGIQPQATLIDPENKTTFNLLDPEEARQHLKDWLLYWQTGHSKPLPFFPRASMAAAESMLKNHDRTQISIEALKKWQPRSDLYTYPESEHPVLRFVFRHAQPIQDEVFFELVASLLCPLRRCLLSTSSPQG